MMGVRLILITSALVLGLDGAGTAAAARASSRQSAIAPQFSDARLFVAAIASAARTPARKQRLTGIAVPHHLVAAELIARAFQRVDAAGVRRVVVLFPDHYRRARQPFATAIRPFDTVFGRIEPGAAEIGALLRSRDVGEQPDLLARDHGLGAILPFIRHYLPGARIIPIAVALNSDRDQWDRLVARLSRLVGPDTLVVQSTDFSHSLPWPEAVQRDQEVMNILATDDIEAAARLVQPSHVDSRGSQYIQMRLQRLAFGARPIVLFNDDTRSYSNLPAETPTSYIVQAYGRDALDTVAADLPGSRVYCFAGDTFFGRGVLRALADEARAAAVRDRMLAVLNGCRLVVNLTGVLVTEWPTKLEPTTLAMPADLTLRWLKALNTVAASLANNHGNDLGEAAAGETARLLREAGIPVLEHGTTLDLGAFRLGGLTDLDNRRGVESGLVSPDDLRRVATSAGGRPLFVMVNWGTDFEAEPRERQREIADALGRAAVGLVIGVHPHLAAAALARISAGTLAIHALGNFLFDQSSRVSSGALLEVRVFERGTFSARLVPHRNFQDEGGRMAGPGPSR